VTAYEGNDPECKPTVYTKGMDLSIPVATMFISCETKAPSSRRQSQSNSSGPVRRVG